MSKHSDLYGEDILLWSERQGDLLRRLAAGESVSNQVDWHMLSTRLSIATLNARTARMKSAD